MKGFWVVVAVAAFAVSAVVGNAIHRLPDSPPLSVLVGEKPLARTVSPTGVPTSSWRFPNQTEPLPERPTLSFAAELPAITLVDTNVGPAAAPAISLRFALPPISQDAG